MTDTPSSILLLRLQSVGSNTNLWGGYLNAAMQTLERASKGYQALAVTASATISWTNYSAANDGAVMFLKLTGSLSSAVALTFPGYQHYIAVWNATGAAVTIKCSGGTGVTLQNGDRALLYCDAIDYYNAAPTLFPTGLTVAGRISGLVAGSAGTDATTLAQVGVLIAASVPLGTAGTFFNTVADTTRGYLADKFTFSNTGLLVATLATQNPAGNENSLLAIDDRRLRRRSMFIGLA